MKFGKKYLETLGAPGIPAEWRQTAIEYRKLKKVINRVATELEDLGLTSDVLKDLLEQQQEEQNGRMTEVSHGASGVASGSRDGDDKHEADVRVEAVQEEDEDDDKHSRVMAYDTGSSDEDHVTTKDNDGKGKGKGRRASRKRRPHASYELSGTSEHPEPRIRLIFDSASSASISESSLDEAQAEQAFSLLHVDSSDTDPSSTANGRFTEITSEEEEDEPLVGHDGKEEDSSNEASSTAPSGAFVGAGPKENKLLKKMYNMDLGSDEERDWEKEEIRVEPGRRRRTNSVETIKSAFSAMTELKDGEEREEAARVVEEARDAATEADDEDESRSPKIKRRRHLPRRHRKEVFIPLNSDTEFLTLLASALASLAALQIAQKKQFAQSVQILAREVSNVSSPNRPKSDLYVWREIFSLWVEAQIFESERERDRGERTVEVAEEKLEWFVEQVAKRKLGKKMKNKESRDALEKFIKLNVELLDMKRFQMANEEAARKILKKHDKRTALTASRGFPQFIAAASSLSTQISDVQPTNSSGSSARVLILPGFPSLPHILLSTLTSTLLPIIPQLEDYECGICGDVAFKPIRLDCGHKFCVRCLVKMQKRGQDGCPQCRSPVVLRANAKNLDHAMQAYLQMWFPKEVKAKQKSNEREAAMEHVEEMGLDNQKCLVQ